MMPELDAVMTILDGIGADPALLSVEHVTASNEPIIKITFRRRADVEAFAKVEKVKVDTLDKSIPLNHWEYSALYDRDGRRMLIQHLCFPHCPDRSES